MGTFEVSVVAALVVVVSVVAQTQVFVFPQSANAAVFVVHC
jgi:hypothetical protein